MFLEFRKRFRRRFRRRTTAAAPEFDFPEPIIQLIQSFLTSKEAAQTTLLSKSWHSAWLTRPNLDFHLADICRSNLFPKFMKFAEKTLERYENLNLKIDSFRLSNNYQYYGSDACDACRKLVCRALKLGPTHLTFQLEHSSRFRIPDELFRYENLVSLTLKRCRINMKREDLCCSRLRFLSLEHVIMQWRDTIFRIMKSCPLIEKLSMDSVRHDDDYYGDDDDDDDDDENIYNADDESYDYDLDFDSRLHTNINLHRLTSLVLNCLNFDTLFLADLSSKFPSLKDLTLNINNDREEIQISSPTLERLELRIGDGGHIGPSFTVHRVKLDVPSIRKLTFVCTSIPKLSLKSNSRGWESDIYVTHRDCPSTSWFYKLSHFLRELRFSRLSLLLYVTSCTAFDYEVGEIRGLPTPEIENLDIYHEYLPTLICYALFDGLFRVCHPRVIGPYMSDNDNIRFLGKRLLEARDAKVSTPNYQFMHGLNDLKEARAQVFDAAVSTWRDVSLESSVGENSTIIKEGYYNPKFCFLLNWKQ